MSLTEEVSFDKEGKIERFPLIRKLFLALSVILIASLSFGLGRLSVVSQREPVKIEYDPLLTQETLPSITQTASVVNTIKNVTLKVSVGETNVVVSKNGTKYHYLHCSGAKQIKEENKISFSTPAEAETAGYTLAANCKPK